ncbi:MULTISPECIES: gamma-glutamyltransferase [unclassified Marinobacter]|jgi:gamma-glutamyltranspeptidase/glutathione hydrolase|uniref:gamma-glutamyltransferase n=1 Tax=unclassified Marinobacter TaxID=83889 RepID=UPI00200E49F2|nr:MULTISPECIES: gamma-glutamyltransferase [unclassified Marinobacter]MCL1478812.1 gamma-glutamyltransferase [Marinobacter sp.]MCL1484073.1 gamma-glutamyltransferase [Marinobacter sp.]MCL1487408.1 gamma-glutamyltransferase [Marinobacter sp.]UQG57658.1 gamma-glutamyltransferase [Marinobacter sp. M4C]UQG66463.1 gamma-glutamyltransferase [Marinobacter sp. M2C]
MYSHLQAPNSKTGSNTRSERLKGTVLGAFFISARLTIISISLAVSYGAHANAILEGERFNSVTATQGMVSTSHTLATEVALQVLKDGGNAVDAAVTAGFALAVTQPRSGNIGGGGFMLIAPGDGAAPEAIDYRETAPAAATEDLFLDEDGKVDQNRSRFTHKAAGVPGTVAGLALALERHGSISLKQALAPAIKLASDGFVVPRRFSEGLEQARDRMTRWPATLETFYKEDGSAWQPGERFRQPELAATLQRIADQGTDGFYKGETARLIAEEMARHDGLITEADLAGYKPAVRTPVHGTYRGYDIYSMSPPSSGGVHIVQILNILEGFPIAEFGHNSASAIHHMAEAMKLAYADRTQYLGDTDFVDVPVAGLISKGYAEELRGTIRADKTRPASEIKPGQPAAYESPETTHFSVVDRWGNAVSNTYTINFSYGSGITVAGAGFLLNNEMDDFSAKPGVPNAYGLIGGAANKIEPGKRMLSSMSPTVVRKDGRNFLVTGSPGGSRIITTTLQVIMNVIDHGMNIQSAVSVPRIHHQWLPDQIRIEQGISADTVKLLESKGHTVVTDSAMGAIQSIMIGEDGTLYGGADPRRSTSSAQGF